MVYLPELFGGAAEHYNDHVAIVEGDNQWTYGQLRDDVEAMAHALRDRVRGDTVGILLLNSARYVTTMLAVWKAGKTAVPLNYLLPPADLGFIAKDSGMSALIASQFFSEAVSAFRPLFGDRGVILMADDPEWIKPSAAAGSADFRDPALILYTSGTTGRPKGVVLTHRNLSTNVESCRVAANFTAGDRFLCLLPFFHTYAITGTMLLPLLSGSGMVLVDRFQPVTVLKMIEGHRITTLLAIPSMYRLMAAAEGSFDLGSLRFPISGGEPLPAAVAEGFEGRFGIPIFEGYGQTEASPVITLNTVQAHKPGTVGRPLPDVEVAIWDDSGKPVEGEMIGEIMVRGDSVMQGYHGLPEETSRTITKGWLHTGDLGKLDRDGYVSITGRKKELIISAGENIYPREIEELLVQHPGVKEGVVIGVKDEVRGEVPKAFVIAREGTTLDEKELRAFCRDRLANYKVPKYFQVVDDLPRTPSGKVLKRMLS